MAKKTAKKKEEKKKKPISWVKMHFKPKEVYIPWHDGLPHEITIKNGSKEYKALLAALKTIGVGE